MKNRNCTIASRYLIGLVLLCFSTAISAQDVFVTVYACPQDMTFQYIDPIYKADESDRICNSGTYINEDPELTSGAALVNSVKVTRLDGGPHRAQVDINWKDNTQGILTIRITYKKRISKLTGCKWSDRYLYTLIVKRQNWNPQGVFEGQDIKSTVGASPVEFNFNYTPVFNEPSAGFGVTKIRYTNVGGDLVNKVEAEVVRDSFTGVYTPTQLTYTATGVNTYIMKSDVYVMLRGGCGMWIPLADKTIKVISSCHRDEFSGVSLSVIPVPTENQFLNEDPPAFAINVNQTYSLQVTGLTDFDSNYTWDFSDFGENYTGDATGFTVSTKGSYRITVHPNVTDCPVPSGVIVMAGIGPGDRLTIEQTCSIVLPMDVSAQYRQIEDNDVIFSHFKALVSTERSIIINPGVTLALGAELVLENPEPAPGPGDDVDLNRNFVEQTTFDEYGRVIGAGRSYFDEGGLFQQAQAKNLSESVILANAIVYDMYNRAAIQTLPAPIIAAPSSDEECPNDPQVGVDVAFEYKPNFLTVGPDEVYTYSDFDLTANENNPAAVDHSQEGTLGWYYSSNNVSSTNSRMREPLVAQTQYPFSRTVYHNDGSGDVKGTTRPGDEFKPGSSYMSESQTEPVAGNDPYLTTATTGYLAIRHNELGFPDPPSIESQFFRTVSEDEMSRKVISYTDKAGNTIVSVYLGTGATAITTSYSYYDNAGRLILTISPKGLADYTGTNFADIDKTRYEYNSKGLLVAVEEKMAGQTLDGISRTEYKYRKDGQIRFSQSEIQRNATNKRFSYTNYDAVGRPIESGEFTASSGDPFTSGVLNSILEDISPTGGLPDMDGSRSEQSFTVFDEVQNNVPGDRRQRFIHGAVSYSRKGNDITTWYSYDERGRVEWLVQNILGLGVKTIDYRYGANGQIQDVVYQRDVAEDRFTHHYEYDFDGNLSRLYTTREELSYDRYGKLTNTGVTYAENSETIVQAGPLQLQATYHYYLHGPLKRIEFPKPKQGIDYVYTADGSLKSLNSASNLSSDDPGQDGNGGGNTFDPDVFGMSLDYHIGDYTGADGRTDGATLTGGENQYSGMIRAMRWHSPIESSKQYGYVYAYDSRNQFAQADWGTLAGGIFTPNVLQAYLEKVPGYDPNGNITSLQRKASENLLESDNEDIGIADFTYHYKPNSNILDHITEDDETVRSYVYDDVGRMVQETVDGSTKYVIYDVSGKVTGVYSDAGHTKPITLFKYDDRGFRMSKTVHDENGLLLLTTWYVRDAAGAVMATYEQYGSDPVKPVEIPVYAQGRIGLYKPDVKMTFYELTDHLGNVRAVVGEPITMEYMATMEEERLATETDDGFLNLDPAETSSDINHTAADFTLNRLPVHIGDPDEVNRLNNRPLDEAHPDPVGTGIVLWVHPGDELDIEVKAKYANFNSGNSNILSGLAGFLATAFTAAPVVDGSPIFNIINDPGFTALPVFEKLDDDQPRAFLNYLLFDNNNKLVDYDFDQVTSAAEITGPGPHETLTLSDIQIKKEGFIYIYVSNLSDQNMDVYFDDLKVTHTLSKVVGGGDYYPFGLAIKDRQIDREEYRHGYQGQNSEKDDETGWNHFELREYDPVIGRWTAVDPKRQFFSPYMGIGNNPVNGTDEDGGFFDDIFASTTGRTTVVKTNDKFDRLFVDGEYQGKFNQGFWKDVFSDAKVFDNYGRFFSETYGSDLGNKEFFAYLYNRTWSEDQRSGLFQAVATSKDPRALLPLAIPVAAIAGGELLAAAPAIGGAMEQLSWDAYALKGYLDVTATNTARRFSYSLATKMKPLLLAPTYGTLAWKAGATTFREMIHFGLHGKVDVAKTAKVIYDATKTVKKFVD